MQLSDEDMLNTIDPDNSNSTIWFFCIGYMNVDFSVKMKLKDYEEGFFVPVNENTNDISKHLSLMYKSGFYGCPIICSTGESYINKEQLICPVIFKNVTGN